MADGKGEEASALPPAQRSTWTSFIKSIASVSGDLSSMTAPPFILSPVSLTEFPAYWLERPSLFADIANGVDTEDRALRVLKWFISTLKGQYTSRNEKMGSEKKPLNPVLGELFYGHWPDDASHRGVTELSVEQVSHHPPITAYYITNESKGLVLQGHNAQKTSFSSGSIIVKQVGHAVLTFQPKNGGPVEKYLISLPKLRIDGLWYGAPYIELSDTSYIQSSTGYTATIAYSGKGYFSGKSHTFKASFGPSNPHSSSSPAAVVIDGQWDTTSKVTTAGSKHLKSGNVFTDVTSPKEEVAVKNIDEQGEWESRKLWDSVAKGIRSGDFEAASQAKTKIENDQRQRRRDEAAAGTPWQLRMFVHVEQDPDYAALLGQFKSANLPASEDAYIYKPPSTV